MLNSLRKTFAMTASTQIKRNVYMTSARTGDLGEKPGLVAKRLINCVGQRLRKVDPNRWSTVPITFKTNFKDDAGRTDIRLAIEIHDAIEREFGIDVPDKKILIGSIEEAYFVVMQSHTALQS